MKVRELKQFDQPLTEGPLTGRELLRLMVEEDPGALHETMALLYREPHLNHFHLSLKFTFRGDAEVLVELIKTALKEANK